MRSLALGTLVVAGWMLVAGCDDDDGPPVMVQDSGADAPVAARMCTATFAKFNRTSLGAQTNPAGKCAATADLDVICANDVGGAARTCGRTCYSAGGDDEACTRNCVAMTIKPSVSAGCLSCYEAAFKCTAANCVNECVQDASSPGCISCQQMKGCLPMYYTCSGLPVPGAAASDGGTDATTGG